METPVGPPGILVANRFDRGADYAVQRRAGTHDWLLTYTLAGLGRFRSGASPNHPGARLQGHVLFHPPAGTAWLLVREPSCTCSFVICTTPGVSFRAALMMESVARTLKQ